MHLLLCHLEEVLADDRWRRHYITAQPRDHHAYDAAGFRDPAFPATCALIAAYPGPVHIITTRSERFRRNAERWLAHHVAPLPLHMRPLDDTRPAVSVVLSQLDAMRNSDLYPTIAFAADPVIIQAYRRRGHRLLRLRPPRSRDAPDHRPHTLTATRRTCRFRRRLTRNPLQTNPRGGSSRLAVCRRSLPGSPS